MVAGYGFVFAAHSCSLMQLTLMLVNVESGPADSGRTLHDV